MGDAVEARVGTDGQSYYLTDLSHRFIWWQCKDDAFKLADNVQRIQIRRIERDMLETEELVRRCLGLLSGGVAWGGEDGSGGSGSDSGGGGGGIRRRRGGAGEGGGGRKRSRSASLPPMGRAKTSRGREVVTEERESVKVREGATDGHPPVRKERERDRDRDRSSRYEVVRPSQDEQGRIIVDVDLPRERDRGRPAPVYAERERSRYGDRDRDRYR